MELRVKGFGAQDLGFMVKAWGFRARGPSYNHIYIYICIYIYIY